MEFIFIILLCSSLAIGHHTLTVKEAKENFASTTSNMIAANMLKASIDIDSNEVFSPLGIAVILAVLAESSGADTYAEFNKILGYPSDRTDLKASFKNTLMKYQNLENNANPSFQTWMYIEPDFHIRQAFRDLLAADYFINVVDIDHHKSNWSEPEASDATTSNSKDVIGFETLKRTNFNDDTKSDDVTTEILAGLDERKKFKSKNINKLKKFFYQSKNLGNSLQIMAARSLFGTEDVASSLSATSITCPDSDVDTKLLLFNGLYYFGKWANQFHELTNRIEYFFITSEEGIQKTMMVADGFYRTATLDHLKAQAVKIPYEGDKYSLLIMLPNDVDGLHFLIEELRPNHLKNLNQHLQSKSLRIILPKFEVEKTSHSEAMLKKLGLQKIFSQSNETFAFMSDEYNLHLNEIVQYVNIKVDYNTDTKDVNEEFLKRLENEKPEEFIVNRPFIFFLMDEQEDLVITSGKICIPESKGDASL